MINILFDYHGAEVAAPFFNFQKPVMTLTKKNQYSKGDIIESNLKTPISPLKVVGLYKDRLNYNIEGYAFVEGIIVKDTHGKLFAFNAFEQHDHTTKLSAL